MNVHKTLEFEEGKRLQVYLDTHDNETVGIGHRVRPGDGLRLGDAITEARCQQFFEADVATAREGAKEIETKWIGEQPQEVTDILTCMVFQMGLKGVITFELMLYFLGWKDYKIAAEEMLDSKWHREDSPARVKRMAALMAAVDGKAAVC